MPISIICIDDLSQLQLRAAEQIEKDIDMLVDLRNESETDSISIGYCSPEAAQETKR